MEFFSSEIGVAIAWICTVLSFLFGFIKSKENKKLKIEIKQFQDIRKTAIIDNSKDDVTQNGKKNIYTKINNGGMNIKM